MNASNGSRRLAESITKAQILDDLAQIAAGIVGASDAWTMDFLGQVERVLGIHHNQRFAHFKEDQAVNIGDRLRALRKEKKLSQRDLAKKTGLLRCNMWRLEIGRQVPTIETLEKIARALEIPMYQLFYDYEEPPKLPNLPKRKSAKGIVWGNSGKDAHMLAQFCRLFGRMKEDDRGLVLFMAQKMARRKAV
jgi:transcriptional regulator with XRE-family HTH domain